jgi:23S rRNA (guanine745-N1)-methyltransferase
MLDDVLSFLRCPVCGGPLARATTADAVRCPAGHSFDPARQGYLPLSAGPVAHPGDDAAMVAARADFLAAGHYDFISDALAKAAAAAGPDAARTATGGAEAREARGAGEAGGIRAAGEAGGLIADVGAGTGYHLAAVLDARPGSVGLAVDSSKYALRRAARAHPRAGAVLCDAWSRLPVADHSAAVVLDVFAPRNGPEFARVIRPGGQLLVVTPEPGHLTELVDRLGLLRVDPAKEDRVAASLASGFTLTGSVVLERVLNLRHEEVLALVGMGPSAWHVDRAGLAAEVARLPDPVSVTAQVRLSRYRPQ